MTQTADNADSSFYALGICLHQPLNPKPYGFATLRHEPLCLAMNPQSQVGQTPDACLDSRGLLLRGWASPTLTIEKKQYYELLNQARNHKP